MGTIVTLLPFLGQLVDKLLPDPQAKAAAQLELAKMAQSGELAQLAAVQAVDVAQAATNTAEAAGNWWQSGWRPAIGWVCAGALASQYILRPWVQWFSVVMGHPLPQLPGIDDQLWQLMGGMLGMGTLRTIEKIKGAA